MTVQLHTGSRTVTIGADFLVWDVPCHVVLTDPWQLREARDVLRRELTELDRAARPPSWVGRRRGGGYRPQPGPARPFAYGVTTAPANGTDSKAGTLVHETSHFTVVAGTDDHVYGQTGAHNLAVSNPTNAVDNVDNHEYFAENTPARQ